MNYRNIALVDFSYFLRVAYHARANDSGPNECAQHVLNQLSGWRRKFDHIIVCLDSPPYHRCKVYEGYKAQRDKSDQSYPQIAKWARERLEADGYSIAKSPGYEADDVMATLAHRISQSNAACSVALLTADKDASQCIFGNVTMWAPKSGGDFEVRAAQWVQDKWGIKPEQVPMLLAICGDKSDNIPGVAGIGDKGATKLIQQFGSFANMRAAALKEFEAAKESGKELAAFWRKFLAGAPELEKWLQLTTLNVGVELDLDALMTKQTMKPLVEDGMRYDPEDDGRPSEPDWDAVAEETEQQQEMLPPEVAIPAPKVAPSTPSGGRIADPKEQFWTTKGGGGGESLNTAINAPVQTVASARSSSGGSQKNEPEHDVGSAIVTTGEAVAPHWNLSLQPRTANEAMHIAKVLFNSRLYGQYGSERGVYAVISLGRELGLGMAASLAGFHIVNDRPFASANLLRSLAETDPNCEYFVCIESDDTKATWETKHRKFPTPMRYTYTAERARQAGMFTGANKHNWNTKTQEMLEKTAGAKAARRWYPSRTLGLHCTEEMSDD